MTDIVRNVRLYGKLGALFGRVHRLAVSSPAEAVGALSAQLPGFQSFLNNSKASGMTFAVFVGKENVGKDDLKRESAEGDIRIAPIAIGSKKNGIFQTILGIVLVVIGVIGNMYGGWGTPFINAGIGMIIGGVVQLLSPQPKGLGSEDGPDNKPSYSFNGPVNTQAQGNPVPLLYGELIVGSAVISAGITNDDVVIPTDPCIDLIGIPPQSGISAWDYLIGEAYGEEYIACREEFSDDGDGSDRSGDGSGDNGTDPIRDGWSGSGPGGSTIPHQEYFDQIP